MEELVGEWDIHPDQVKTTQELLKAALPTCRNQRVRNMAIGSVYFELKAVSTVKEKETDESVARITKLAHDTCVKFTRVHHYPVEHAYVVKATLYMYFTETTRPGIRDIIEMFIEKNFYDYLRRSNESIPLTVPVLNT
ncbi:hypothetical protein PsorP6_016311 [Peronosclerospora sorghi]|uniref:Uncharacterized protein n=1 Tax=Peronosclerospora sorghi TaxID=230839 RepID=A0ACC0VTA0_9STRA|nr:hypothetical protein PsorP6_016311 [Peronosclerospora sorghi]